MKLKRIISFIAMFAMTVNLTAFSVRAADIGETIDNDSADTTYASYTKIVDTTDIEIAEGGKFRIEYSGEDANIVLIMSDRSGGGDHSWVTVSAKAETGTTEIGYYVDYAYNDLIEAWGSEDFSDLKAVRASTWGKWENGASQIKVTTIDSITWIPGDGDGEEITETPEPTEEPAKTAELSDNIAIYNTSIAAYADNVTSYTWYQSANAAGDNATVIDGATDAEFVPGMENIGGWIYCVLETEAGALMTSKVRVAASMDMIETEYPIGSTVIADYDLAFLSNTVAYSGKIDMKKLAYSGYVYAEFSGINDNEDVSQLPQLQLGTWSSQLGRQSKNVYAYEHGATDDGKVWVKYSYSDIVSAWYDDADFNEVKALRIHYSGTDKASLNVETVKYAGPMLSYGDTGEAVEMKGSYSSYQYLFTWHVGGTFDTTRLKDDSVFFVEYTGDEGAVNLIMQSHSAAVDGENVKSTYATVKPFETGKTGSGYYSKFSATDIENAFGNKLRYIDTIRIGIENGKSLTSSAVMYYLDGNGELIDDISVDGYDDAIKVPWTKYDNTDKDGIAIIGASITQNPLVTPLAMSGKPFYWAQGGWNAMLDRTDMSTYGIGSQTTTNIANRFDEVLRYDYKQIIIQCGNNDLGAFSGTGAAEAAAEHEYNNYVIMMDKVAAKNEELKASGKPEIKVHILALNPVNSDATNAKIPTVIEKLNTLEEKYDFVTYVEDIYTEFLDVETGHSKTDFVMADGLHPVAEGYAIYAKYLKPLISSDDKEDTTLSSLSYRISDTDKKYPVTDFESTKSNGTENTYEILLPNEVNELETFKLYVTPTNLNAIVIADGAELKTDEYGNDYIDVSVNSENAVFTVTSADKTKSESYIIKINVDADSYIYENAEVQTVEVTDENSELWHAYINYMTSNGNPVYNGTLL